VIIFLFALKLFAARHKNHGAAVLGGRGSKFYVFLGLPYIPAFQAILTELFKIKSGKPIYTMIIFKTL
jgi:hypothetical protein